MNALVPPAGVEIVEAGLVIRPWRADDADAVFRACQDPLIQRWTTVPRPYELGHAEGFVTTVTETSWKSGSSAPLGVFDQATGQLLGSNGLVRIDPARAEAEIGYWTAPWARGQGSATAASRAVARWAMQSLDLNRLIWRSELGNHASRLVAERIGVRVEGVVRQSISRADGTPVDAWTGSLLPGQLREADAPTDPVAALRATTFSAEQPRLHGSGVTLRPVAHHDIPAIVAAAGDPESARWTTVPIPYGRADAEFFVTEHAPGGWLRGDAATFAIIDKSDAYAGTIELRLTGPGTGDVGYLVAPWARGRGHASAALRTVCAWGFESLGLHRIEWSAYVGNDASRRVAEKAGFTVEGLARGSLLQRGERRDCWTGAKLSTDPR